MADKRASGKVIELTEVVEEGVPLESLVADSIEANIDQIFSQDQQKISSDLLDGDEDDESGAVSPDEEAELAAILKEVEDSGSAELESGEGPGKDSDQEVDEFEALLAEVGGTDELEPPPDSGSREPEQESETPSEDDLDSLLAAVAGETPPEDGAGQEPVSDEEPLSQDDLEALLNEAGGDTAEEGLEETPETTEEPQEEGAPLSQDDLDALLNQTVGEDAAPAEEPPVAPEPQAEDREEAGEEEPLSQDDLDALLSGFDDSAEPASQPEPAEEEEELLTQDDLDDLLGSVSGDSEKSPAPIVSSAPAAECGGRSGLDNGSSQRGRVRGPDRRPTTVGRSFRSPDRPRSRPPKGRSRVEGGGGRGVRTGGQGTDTPPVTEEVLTREIAALRQELVAGPE